MTGFFRCAPPEQPGHVAALIDAAKSFIGNDVAAHVEQGLDGELQKALGTCRSAPDRPGIRARRRCASAPGSPGTRPAFPAAAV